MDRAEENNFALDYILSQSDLAGKVDGVEQGGLKPVSNGMDEDDEVLI
jgi:hypothetical protein